MLTSSLSPKRDFLVLATLGVGLALDVRTDIVGQLLVSCGVWAVLFYILLQTDRTLRYGIVACLVIATAGELFLSLVWGLYTYRLGNVPLFVPPGHVFMLLLGLSLARRISNAVAYTIIIGAGIYALVAAITGFDTLAVPLFLVLAAASFAMPAQRRLYASTFMCALVLELYGTWLGNWTWARDVPWLPLVTSNPPGVASAFYCALDALVSAAMLMQVPRWMSQPGAGRAPESRARSVQR